MKSAADLDLRRISRKAGNCPYFPVCHPALVRSPHFKFLYIIPVTVMMMVMMVRMMMMTMIVMMMMMTMMVVEQCANCDDNPSQSKLSTSAIQMSFTQKCF